MATSLKKRFDPIKDEVLDYVETFGAFPAMQKYGVLDYPAFHRWLKEETGNEDFGLTTIIKPELSLGEQVLSSLLNKIDKLKSENKQLKEQLHLVEGYILNATELNRNRALDILKEAKEFQSEPQPKLVYYWGSTRAIGDNLSEASPKRLKAPEDHLINQARELKQNYKKISVSFLQRKLRIGYPRAARIMEQLKEEGD